MALTTCVLSAVRQSDLRCDTEGFACTVMPEHVHGLFRLGSRLALGRVIARLKAETRPALARHGLEWQRDFFERRLRAEDSIEPFGFYIFMNPYWDGLVTPGEVWPGWWCPRAESFDFAAKLAAGGTPGLEWLSEDPRAKRKLSVWQGREGTQQVCAPTEKPESQPKN